MELGARKSRGFTMIEVFVVSLILGISFAIGIPKYVDFLSSQSVLELHDTIVAKLQEALPLSKSLRKPVYAVIDFDGEKVWLEVDGKIYGAKVPSTASTSAEISGMANNTVPSSPNTIGTAQYRFDYWGTAADTPALPSDSIHVGLKMKKVCYSVNFAALSADFRTITIVKPTGQVVAYPAGCNGTAIAFGTPQWPQCSDL